MFEQTQGQETAMDKALLSVLILSFIQTTYSCRCAAYDFHTHLCTYDLVFLGTVVSEKPPSSPDRLHEAVYTFRIEAIFWVKNQLTGIGQSLDVRTKTISSLCGVVFQLNQLYVVSPFSYSGNWTTGSCSFNRLWSTVPPYDKVFLSETLKRNCSQQSL